ncbi:Hypothetical protein PAU_04220 [Photorhabdus asymbiotica]|uniref:Uncharacterized protein n=1 Tax=Photorhabdus asymbiotica subsp. asymbiotica (strain ATCC 43949 / 3105-77) TaxID=553480 RepID=C7BRA0_PHOAA|nr:Hypothetical protein PAU_04220 [Photorhabdus asymbiotica]
MLAAAILFIRSVSSIYSRYIICHRAHARDSIQFSRMGQTQVSCALSFKLNASK